MNETKAVYNPNTKKSTYEMPKYDSMGKAESSGSESGLLMRLEWPEEGVFDDGKQSNTLTGAAHPGCCKQ